MIRFVVKYTEDEDEKNIKRYGVYAHNKTHATELVIEFIEQHKHHPSINYGYTLLAKASPGKVNYMVNESPIKGVK